MSQQRPQRPEHSEGSSSNSSSGPQAKITVPVGLNLARFARPGFPNHAPTTPQTPTLKSFKQPAPMPAQERRTNKTAHPGGAHPAGLNKRNLQVNMYADDTDDENMIPPTGGPLKKMRAESTQDSQTQSTMNDFSYDETEDENSFVGGGYPQYMMQDEFDEYLEDEELAHFQQQQDLHMQGGNSKMNADTLVQRPQTGQPGGQHFNNAAQLMHEEVEHCQAPQAQVQHQLEEMQHEEAMQGHLYEEAQMADKDQFFGEVQQAGSISPARATMVGEPQDPTDPSRYAKMTPEQIKERLKELGTKLVGKLKDIDMTFEKNESFRSTILAELKGHEERLQKQGKALEKRRAKLESHFFGFEKAVGIKLR